MSLGPRDSSLIGPGPDWLDCGCLRVRRDRPFGVSVIGLNPELMVAEKLTLDFGHSIVTLEVIAAPRGDAMWPERRDALARQLRAQGIEVQVVMGRFGTEVKTVMPMVNHDGTTTIGSVCFLGVDGPRWMLQAGVSGAAAHDTWAREQVDEAIAEIVVHRGDEPMAPGEALPIRMPEEP